MAQQTPVSVPRIPGGGSGSPARKPGMTPLPANTRRQRRWLKWLVIIPVLVLGITYLLGRTVRPIQVRLAGIPLAGKVLFAEPPWPILWNKPPVAGEKPSAGAGEAGETAPAAQPVGTPAAAAPDFSKLEAEMAARLAAVEVKENELKKREQDAADREAALKAREATIVQQEGQLARAIKANDDLRTRLEGQLRTEQDRVEVIRAMRSSAIAGLFGAMTDEEVLRVLMYMDAEEVGKYLSAMEPYRGARLLEALKQVAPSQSQ